jgi:hypothetical protein
MDWGDTGSGSDRRAQKKARRDDAEHPFPSQDDAQAHAHNSPTESRASYPEVGLRMQQPSVGGPTLLADHGFAPGPSVFSTATHPNLSIGSSQRLRLHQELDAAIRGRAWDTTAPTPWTFADQMSSAQTGVGLSSVQLPQQAGAVAMHIQPGIASLQWPTYSSQFVLSGMPPTIFGSYPNTIGVASLDRTYLDALAMATAFQSHPFSQPAQTLTMNQFISNTNRPLAFVVPQPLIAPSIQSTIGDAESPATAVARSMSQLASSASSTFYTEPYPSQQDAPSSTSSSSSSSQLPQGPPQQKCVFPMWCDEDQLSASKYQCVLRRQIEYFVADHQDLQVKAQGRNIPIRLGQVGIRCRHCARVDADAEGRAKPAVDDAAADGAAPGGRTKHSRAANTGKNTHRRGAVYYPSKVSTIFQAVQNMATNHFVSGACANIPSSTLEEIVTLKSLKPNPSRRGEGKGYWARSAAKLGISNADGGETTGGSGLVLLRRQASDHP